MIYVFDTNSLRTLKNYYPQQFVSFWKQLDAYVATGKIVSVREVRREIERQDITEELQGWVKKNSHIFVKPDVAETQFVAEIFKIKHFQALIPKRNILQGMYSADPFVVACAKIRNGCVVTEEKNRPNAAKIPNVCEYFGIVYTNLQGFMEMEGWQF